MDRRSVLLTGGTVAAGALAGCLGSAQSQSDDRPADEETGGNRTIRVSQSGKATAEPNLAILQVAVEARGDTATSVRDELADRSGTLKEALIEFGIDEDAITTARYDIHERRVEPIERPERDANDDGTGENGEGRENEGVTYEGVHAYSVDVPDVDAIGAVIDTAVDAGADTVGRVQFTVTEETREELREAALRDAMGNARAEADVLAAEAGSSIVDIRTIHTSESSVRPLTRDVMALESADGGGTELATGDVTVTARVEVTYDID